MSAGAVLLVMLVIAFSIVVGIVIFWVGVWRVAMGEERKERSEELAAGPLSVNDASSSAPSHALRRSADSALSHLDLGAVS